MTNNSESGDFSFKLDKESNEQATYKGPPIFVTTIKHEEIDEPSLENIWGQSLSNQEYSCKTLLPLPTSLRPEEIVKTEIRDVHPKGLLYYNSLEDPVGEADETRKQRHHLSNDFPIQETTVKRKEDIKTEIKVETFGVNLRKQSITQELEGPDPITEENSHLANTTNILNRDPKVHECHNCNYRTGRKSDMTRHQLTHQGVEAMLTRTVHECDSCSYKSIRKSDLHRHKLVHKGMDDLDAQVHECAFCSYKSHRKNDLVRHTLIHKEDGDVNLFKCTCCPFRSKWRESFQQHVKTHMNPRDLDFFQCEFCGYQTINKKHLRSHQLVHKSEEEVTMYTCAFCSYNSKRKCNLQRHLRTHTKVETKLLLP